MKVECPRCSLHPVLSRTAKWIATGAVNTTLRRVRAVLQCVQCGYFWSSGLPAAMEAMDVVRKERGHDPAPEVASVKVPQPSIPGTRVLQQPRTFTGVLAISEDWKAKQAGDE